MNTFTDIQFLMLKADRELERLKKLNETLLEAIKILMESTRHAYNCPELKEGLVCNCGFHEAISLGMKAIGQAEEL